MKRQEAGGGTYRRAGLRSTAPTALECHREMGGTGEGRLCPPGPGSSPAQLPTRVPSAPAVQIKEGLPRVGDCGWWPREASTWPAPLTSDSRTITVPPANSHGRSTKLGTRGSQRQRLVGGETKPPAPAACLPAPPPCPPHPHPPPGRGLPPSMPLRWHIHLSRHQQERHPLSLASVASSGVLPPELTAQPFRDTESPSSPRGEPPGVPKACEVVGAEALEASRSCLPHGCSFPQNVG